MLFLAFPYKPHKNCITIVYHFYPFWHNSTFCDVQNEPGHSTAAASRARNTQDQTKQDLPSSDAFLRAFWLKKNLLSPLDLDVLSRLKGS